PTPVVYEYNVMDIDFETLAREETKKPLREMHQHFAQVEPTRQNEYTGYFEGKNLIWLTAEGFSRFVVDPELTPTLYMLANEGFVFRNFYNPLWWVSTTDGEYAATTSLIPKSGVWSMAQSASNSMYFAMGNQLRRQGYATRAYHNHTYSYYHRDQSHPNLGYDYKGLGNGLNVTKIWPESDLEMMEVSGPEYIGSSESPFHTYYMTVSGHLGYTFMGNNMSTRHRNEVSHLPYSEGPRAYLACQLELELALKNLLEQLEEAGELENTVICLSADHYPYGLEQSQLEELNGGPLDMRFELYRSTLILWSGDMEEPIIIDKPCASLDILPTLSNLFGLEYDSRLLMGRDILSDSPGLVILSDRSFIT
ncbi:MAG: LTA synthase family protein, partial [Oscillospiraceae bacterium]|nr:LTA synthase family protein [Oscillospiraceae bacterium]